MCFTTHVLHRRAVEITLSSIWRNAAFSFKIASSVRLTILSISSAIGRSGGINAITLFVGAEELLGLHLIILIECHGIFKIVSLASHFGSFSYTSVSLIVKLLHAHCLVSFLRREVGSTSDVTSNALVCILSIGG